MLNTEFEAALSAIVPPRQTKFISGSALARMTPEPREWLWQDFLPVGCATLFTARGGVGKSLLAKQIGNAVASGTPLLGRTVTRAPVIAIYGEDDTNELVRRQHDVMASLRLSSSDVGAYHARSLFGEATQLGSFDRNTSIFRPNDLFEEIRDDALALGARLIIIDNLTQCYPGDINNPSEVTAFLQKMNGLALEIRGSVLLLGHTAKDKESDFAGTAAWVNGVRHHIYMTRAEGATQQALAELQGRKRTLVVNKANYGATGVSVDLLWEAGAYVLDAGQAVPLRAAPPVSDSREQFREFLRKLTNNVTSTSSSKRAANYAPKVMAERYGVSQISMERAMEALMADDLLVDGEDLGWSDNRRRRVKGLKLIDTAPRVSSLADLLTQRSNRQQEEASDD